MLLLLALFLALPQLPTACPAERPVPGAVVRPFAPQGAYAGHWGVDLAAALGSPVRSVAAGMVTFAGGVAGRLTVTVLHGGEVRTSYSYLSAVGVSPGQPLAAGEILGRSGLDRGLSALHLSLRVGRAYVDPERWLDCRLAAPATAGHLAPALPPYA